MGSEKKKNLKAAAGTSRKKKRRYEGRRETGPMADFYTPYEHNGNVGKHERGFERHVQMRVMSYQTLTWACWPTN